ncbi:MAG: NAD(P)H-dependent oxidoreductase [Paracoccus sp. (in: a-proteobacteria)]|nr:NAD(P)H-dependent oxidoreductase [Paracoccus sp. (in: a-proteobacteria)]
MLSRLAAGDVLSVTPKHDNRISGVFKSAVDRMSRGDGLAMFVGKPVAVIGASSGVSGTIRRRVTDRRCCGG